MKDIDRLKEEAIKYSGKSSMKLRVGKSTLF